MLAFSSASLWNSMVDNVPSICASCFSYLFLRFRAWRAAEQQRKERDLWDLCPFTFCTKRHSVQRNVQHIPLCVVHFLSQINRVAQPLRLPPSTERLKGGQTLAVHPLQWEGFKPRSNSRISPLVACNTPQTRLRYSKQQVAKCSWSV